ncbi:MAG: hypothetical protein M1820_008132 [Bogoriella megaspora]|nr:MAG: hypothetical protein M1820_008132 [Bogoriella megaspora]
MSQDDLKLSDQQDQELQHENNLDLERYSEEGNEQSYIFNPLMIHLGFSKSRTRSDSASEPFVEAKWHQCSPIWSNYANSTNGKAGSWKTMLAVQPPARSVTLSLRSHYKDSLVYQIRSAHEEGILLGELVASLAAIHRRLKRQPRETETGDWTFPDLSYKLLEPTKTRRYNPEGLEAKARIYVFNLIQDGADVDVVQVDSDESGRGGCTYMLSFRRGSKREGEDLRSPEGAQAFQLIQKDQILKVDIPKDYYWDSQPRSRKVCGYPAFQIPGWCIALGCVTLPVWLPIVGVWKGCEVIAKGVDGVVQKRRTKGTLNILYRVYY